MNGIIWRRTGVAFASVIPFSIARSHLFMRITHARCASRILPTMRMSCFVGPSSLSRTSSTTSASSIAFSLRKREKLSTLVLDICVCFFMPAVSTSV